MIETLWRLDVSGLRALYGQNGPHLLTLVMIALTVSGSSWRYAVLVPLLALRRTRTTGLGLAVVLVVTDLAVRLLKHTAGRHRPPFVLPDIHALWGPADGPSFPSGHTTASFAMATFLALVLMHRSDSRVARLGAAILFAWAAGVGMSRVYLGVHFPSDVLGSVLIGGTIGAAGARVFFRAQDGGNDAITDRESANRMDS